MISINILLILKSQKPVIYNHLFLSSAIYYNYNNERSVAEKRIIYIKFMIGMLHLKRKYIMKITCLNIVFNNQNLQKNHLTFNEKKTNCRLD